MKRNKDCHIGIKYYFLIRARNAYTYFDRCIDSVVSQKKISFKIIYIDDHSSLTNKQKKHMRKKLASHILIFNTIRKYSVRNAYEAIHRYIPDTAIVVALDGDDWLIRDDALSIVHDVYMRTNCKLTYGNCVYYSPNDPTHDRVSTDVHPYANTRYDETHGPSYRKDYFRPLHLKTWSAALFKRIHKKNFLFPNGKWLRFCEDQAIMYPLLELCNKQYYVIDTPLSAYNTSHESSDNKLYTSEKILDEVSIRRNGKKIKLLTNITYTKKNNIHIYHSSIHADIRGWMPLLRQIYALIFRKTYAIFMDGSVRFLQSELLRIAGAYTYRFVVHSMNIGISLTKSLRPLTVDAVIHENLTDKHLENIMWSLTSCDTITNRCLISLKKNNIHVKKSSLLI